MREKPVILRRKDRSVPGMGVILNAVKDRSGSGQPVILNAVKDRSTHAKHDTILRSALLRSG